MRATGWGKGDVARGEIAAKTTDAFAATNFSQPKGRRRFETMHASPLIGAREISHVATLLYALALATWTHIQCGNYAAASAQADEGVAVADERGIVLWRGVGMMNQVELQRVILNDRQRGRSGPDCS